MNEQLELAESISAERLVAAMDDLLLRVGYQQPNKSVAAEYIKPDSDDRVEIESRPFSRVARHAQEDGGHYYTVESIIPHNGGSEDKLTFKNGTVFTEVDTWEQIGENDQERRSEEAELTPKEVAALYREVTDPTLEDRQRAIEAFYHKRHYSRGKIGRMIARVRDADRPRYF